MEKYQKFLNKLDKKLRLELLHIINRIEYNDLDNLDVIKLSGKKSLYRLRKGNIRVIFAVSDEGNKIFNINFRGNVY